MAISTETKLSSVLQYNSIQLGHTAGVDYHLQ